MKRALIGTALVIFIPFLSMPMEMAQSADPYRVIFTTGLDEKNFPKNNVDEISINEERIYIFVQWEISKKKHTSLTKYMMAEGT